MEAAGMMLGSPLVRNNLTSNNGMEYTWNTATTMGKQPVITCQEYINNISNFLNDFFNVRPEKVNKTSEEYLHEGINYAVTDILVPFVCVFGILGNVLNLIVLTRKQLKCTMDCLEKSAHLGLVALAVSDAVFCMLYLPTSMVINDSEIVYTHNDRIITLYYNLYYEPLTNIFLLSSTWLTVIMALARYIAICHPFRARGFINLTGTRVAIICVYIAAVLLNLPRFWHYYSVATSCDEVRSMVNIPLPAGECQCYYYMKTTGSLYKNKQFVLAYSIGYFIISLVIPLLLLTFCNICLIRALRQSYKMQRMYRANTPRDSGHRITPTLITIIILFTVLVTPSELLLFFKEYIVKKQSYGHLRAFMTANTIANFMLLTNFSINFVLYCVINVQFRKVVHNIVCCTWRRKTPAVEYFKTSTMNNTTMCNVSDMETEV